MSVQAVRVQTFAEACRKAAGALSLATVLKLAFILLVGMVVRFNHIRQPYIDAFSWRQSSTAMIAANYYHKDWNIFYPEVNWTGPGPSYQGRELQTVSYLAALLYKLVGEHDWPGRLVAAMFGVLGIFSLYQLVRLVWDERRATLSALVMAVLPGSIFIDRSFLPDPAMVALVTTSFWLLVAYLQSGWQAYLLATSLIGAWGFCTKITGLIICLPMAYTVFAFLKHDRSLARDRLKHIAIYASFAFLPVLAYYLWARHLALSYPPYHFAGSSNWVWDSGLKAWLEKEYFLPRLARHLSFWVWTIPTICLISLGLLSRPSSNRIRENPGAMTTTRAPWVFHWWMIAGLIFYLIGAKELVTNPWNLHLLNPAAAALVANAICMISSQLARISRRIAPEAVAAAIVILIYWNGISNLFYMYQPYAEEGFQLGLALKQMTGPADLVVTMPNDLGDPVAILYSTRRGWVFPPARPGMAWNQLPEDDNESIQLFEELREQGAGWLAIVQKQKVDLENHHPLLDDYIKHVTELKYHSSDGLIYKILPREEVARSR